MLRVADEFHKSDTGRQRRVNEDALFVRTPLFVVADGMGGAQSGEVASKIAVETFADGDYGRGEAKLRTQIELANARINELAQSDPQHAGMGTTVTAALLDDIELAVAHVGDSRAYRFRRGELTRLTQDHSLVGELVARGKLTEEEAEEHPQRSIITRALGPEPTVEVDTASYRVEDGDVYLLCSDGLTSMISEASIAELLSVGDSLERVGQSLIQAANDAGGRDNITVVLFRVEEIEGSHDGSDQPTTIGTPAVTEEQIAEVRAEELAQSPAVDPHELAVEPPSVTISGIPEMRPVAKPKSRGLRRVSKYFLITLLVLTPFAVGGWVASRALYFVGTDSSGFVTVYRGVPYELPMGVDLYEQYYVSGVSVDQLSAKRRKTLLDHRLRSKNDASDLVQKLELGQLAQ